MDYHGIITLEPGKRSGKPTIRGLRVTVYDVLDYLASGMTPEDILRDLPYLTREEILVQQKLHSAKTVTLRSRSAAKLRQA